MEVTDNKPLMETTKIPVTPSTELKISLDANEKLQDIENQTEEREENSLVDVCPVSLFKTHSESHSPLDFNTNDNRTQTTCAENRKYQSSQTFESSFSETHLLNERMVEHLERPTSSENSPTLSSFNASSVIQVIPLEIADTKQSVLDEKTNQESDFSDITDEKLCSEDQENIKESLVVKDVNQRNSLSPLQPADSKDVDSQIISSDGNVIFDFESLARC